MNNQEVKDYALKVLTSIRIYCETSSASGYSEDMLECVNKELEPILEICNNSIRKIRGQDENI